MGRYNSTGLSEGLNELEISMGQRINMEYFITQFSTI
jgi:hypothetical protein